MRAALACIVASAILLGACYSGPDTDHYVGVLDAFDPPPQWSLVDTQRRGPGEAFSCEPISTSNCPGADRWFALSGEVIAALRDAEAMVEAAGYTIDHVSYPACEGPPSGAACVVRASRESHSVYVAIYPPGRNHGLDNPPDVDIIVKITSQR